MTSPRRRGIGHGAVRVGESLRHAFAAGTPGLSDPLDWERDGQDWPNREASRFVRAGGLRWHVQRLGSGPGLLLLHGTGAATHSWRDLLPWLAGRFDVVAPDLPGHGFTGAPPGHDLTLPGMARALRALLRELDFWPEAIVGHSAGAAIGCRMCLDGAVAPRTVVGLNAALLPFRGAAARVFPPLAKLLTWSPGVPRLVAWRARDPAVVGRLIKDSGSRLDRDAVRLYARLVQSPTHVASALAMMARWDLEPLFAALPALAPRLVLLAAEGDRFVEPSAAAEVASRVPGTEIVRIPALGHLAHEERPDEIAARILGLLDAGTSEPDPTARRGC